MILWINGAFGAGKTTAAHELHRQLPNSFIYDPENVGCFIRENSPKSFSAGDFQDIPLWRKMNYEMLKMIQANGIIIVPMTIVSKTYYDEIITKLINDGVTIRHLILYASKETILQRLKTRSKGQPEAFAIQAIDRCIRAFKTDITEIKIMTDEKDIGDVVSEIAQLCNLKMTKGKSCGGQI